MAGLTRDQIKEINDTPLTPVFVKDWNGEVFIRKIKASETERVYDILEKGKIGHPELVVLACCNEDGSPMFSADDVEWLREKSWSAVQEIVQAIVQKHPIMTADTVAIEKN